MSRKIFDLFESYMDSQFDINTAKRCVLAANAFIYKNSNHVSFIGSPYVAVYPIRFVTADRERLYSALGITEISELTVDLHALDEVDPTHHTATDVFNICCLFTMYKIHNLKGENDRKKEILLKEIAMFWHMKFLSGYIKDHFAFATDLGVEKAVFESLSRKHFLRKFGTWIKVLEHRTFDPLDKKSIHFDAINRGTDDRILYANSETANRWSKMIQLFHGTFNEVRQSQSRIKDQSKLTTLDGESVLREHVNKVDLMRRKADSVSRDAKSFNQPELIEVTLNLVTTATEKKLNTILEYYTDNYRADKGLQSLQSDLVIYIAQQARAKYIDINNVASVSKHMQSIFRNARQGSKVVESIKKTTDNYVSMALPNDSKNTRVGTSQALLVYLTLRVLTLTRY